MTEETLLPCPWCGGPATMNPWDGLSSRWTGGCPACDYEAQDMPSREQAVARWNTRAPAAHPHIGDTASTDVQGAPAGFHETVDALKLPTGFDIGARVEKVSGSCWRGRIVGSYCTVLTPIGWAVESENEPGSVQIYPEKALRLIQASERDNPKQIG